MLEFLYFRKKSVAMFLINIGADVSVQAKNGCTAFDMASLIGMSTPCVTGVKVFQINP